MRNAIKTVNRQLYDWSRQLDSHIYTNPYLVLPSEDFIKSRKRILVLGKEPNSWGELEMQGQPSFEWTPSKLEAFYNDKIIEKTISPCAFWRYCWNFEKGLKERDVEFSCCFSNVALLGYRYGKRGYDENLSGRLAEFLKKYIIALEPAAIVCLVGFGTKTHRERPYLRLLEGVFGEYDESKNIKFGSCSLQYPVMKLYFSDAAVPIYGIAHPERKKRQWTIDSINILCDNISSNY